MTTLTTLCADSVASTLADGLLRQAARGEGPLNLRNVATVGGITAAAAHDSEVYAALLALDAHVVVQGRDGQSTTALTDMRAPAGLIIEIQIPIRSGSGALTRVARTPSDRPIVAALCVRDEAGERTALCGVADRPVLDGAPLNPPNDFKGSTEYRVAMAEILRARAAAIVRREDA